MLGTRRRKTLAVLAVLALAGTTTVALAAWLVGGSGSGAARSGALQQVTLSANTGAAPTDLIPSDVATGTLAATVANPNVALKLISVDQNGPTISDDSSACPGTFVTVPQKTGLAIPVPAGSTTVTVPNVVKMDVAAPTGCQGRTFQIPVSAVLSTP
jgi:hypothetical protein